MSPFLGRFASYEDALAGFRLEIPDRFNAVEPIGRSGAPDGPALCCVGSSPRLEVLSFGDLEDATARLASSLRTLGIGPRTRVCVTLPTTPEAAISMLAVMRVGGIAAGVRLVGAEGVWRHQLSLVRPELVICAPDEVATLRGVVDGTLVTAERGDWASAVHGTPRRSHEEPSLADVLASGSPDSPVEATAASDPAFVTFTSGSMGLSKAVVFPHSSFLAAVPAFEMFTDLGPEPGDVFFNSLGWATGGGLRTMAVPALYSGRPIAGVDHMAGGVKVARILVGLRVTVALLMPQVLRELREAEEEVSEWDWSALRLIAYAGEGISSDLQEWLERTLGVVVQTYYGAAETAYVASACRAWFGSTAGDVGRIVPGREVAILDEGSLRPVESGMPGILAIRRSDPALTSGYLRADQDEPELDATAATDEFFLSGDLAIVSDAGEMTYLGRSGQVVLTAEGPVAPLAVEDAILSVHGIREAGAVQLAEDDLGTVRACIALTGGATGHDELAHAVAAAVGRRFEGAVAVRSVVVFEELPKTRGTSKINRRLAAEALRTGEPAPLAIIAVERS
jgi:acetyl-CoA synthetase